ncbi:MAG: FtsW/RodA/SpoVE family cell cycle protein [Lawsonella clevelandensis]
MGQERNGARSWFDFGPVAFQPSELAKVIIIMVVALYLGQLTPMSKIGDTLRPMGLFIPVIVLVILQKDLGMAVTCGVVLLAFLFFGRLPGSVIWITAGGAAVLFLILTLTTGFRTDRLITYWHQLTGGSYDAQGVGYQARQAQLALADGGFTGVGLGQSRAKYFYLPEAPNDFIFAIIGEELGFIRRPRRCSSLHCPRFCWLTHSPASVGSVTATHCLCGYYLRGRTGLHQHGICGGTFPCDGSPAATYFCRWIRYGNNALPTRSHYQHCPP